MQTVTYNLYVNFRKNIFGLSKPLHIIYMSTLEKTFFAINNFVEGLKSKLKKTWKLLFSSDFKWVQTYWKRGHRKFC